MAEEGLANVVYGCEDQWGEDKLKLTRDLIDKLCKKHLWLRELGRGFMVEE